MAKRIQVLEKNVAELIAAGGGGDRPASVVKELLENAIDAGATAIALEIRGGGSAFLRVSDNGSGMEREDVRTAFLRHATSKVRRETDLEAIHTLGFRGEALASVAAVAKVELVTKTEDAPCGTKIVLSGGAEEFFGEAAAERGTTIVVRDLFFNTPARMKFLKTDTAEGNAVSALVDKIALSHPEVSLRYIREGKEQLFTPGDSKLLSAIYAVYGRDFAKGMLEAVNSEGSMRVWGYVSHPDSSRGNRSMQSFFINGRYVRSGTCMAALTEGYKNTIMSGRFPACVLFLELPPETVDVNVHPAKVEVRFANEKPVFDAVYFAVKNALLALSRQEPLAGRETVEPQGRGEAPARQAAAFPSQKDKTPQHISAREYREMLGEGKKPAPFGEQPEELHSPAAPYRLSPLPAQAPPSSMPSREEMGRRFPNLFGAAVPAPEPPKEPIPPVEEPVRGLGLEEEPVRVIGELFSTYILASQGEKLLLIDKHAAHERYLFNRLRDGRGAGEQAQSVLPFPLVFSAEDYGALCENEERLRECGFTLEDLGGKTLMVETVPMYLELSQAAAALSEIAAKLREGRQDLESEKLNWIYESVACRSAVKAGDVSDPKELAAIVELLQRHGEITHCPHGRPITVELTRSAIEKLFGRRQ